MICFPFLRCNATSQPISTLPSSLVRHTLNMDRILSRLFNLVPKYIWRISLISIKKGLDQLDKRFAGVGRLRSVCREVFFIWCYLHRTRAANVGFCRRVFRREASSTDYFVRSSIHVCQYTASRLSVGWLSPYCSLLFKKKVMKNVNRLFHELYVCLYVSLFLCWCTFVYIK